MAVLVPTPVFVRFKKEYGFPEVENLPAPRRNTVFLNMNQGKYQQCLYSQYHSQDLVYSGSEKCPTDLILHGCD